MQINTVKNKKELSEFIDLPWKIYKDYPLWVPPLKEEVKDILNLKKNPFWEHAERELFIVKNEGKTIGRVAAIIDQNHNNFHQEKMGFFGFFECMPDYQIAELLLNRARNWLKEKGMQNMRGPVNPSMNDECGFLLEGFDSSPTIMMPYNPKYYLEFMESYGLKKAKDLFEHIFRKEQEMPQRTVKILKLAKKRAGFVVRPLDKKNLKRDIQILKDIYNAAWEKNWGFVPMTNKEMDLAAEKMIPFLIPELALFAEKNGEPIGVGVAIPDINQVLKKLNGRLNLLGILKFLYYKRKITGIRTLIAGVKKEYRNIGVIGNLLYDGEIVARKLGFDWCEFGWTLEDNDLINRYVEDIGAETHKKYRIYEMKV